MIPILNEEGSLPAIFSSLNKISPQRTEVLFVDGGSTDNSRQLVEGFISSTDLTTRLLESKKGRATQQNAGAAASKGELLLFLHADTMLTDASISRLESLEVKDLLWGRFNIELSPGSLSLSVVSWFINTRSRLTGIATGDQAIFVNRNLFNLIGRFPDQLLMEDVELSKRLKQLAAPICFYEKVITSSRKWLKHGVVRTVVLMWRLRAAYYFGATPDALHKRYYQD